MRVTAGANVARICRCGFRTGEPVKMRSQLTKADGQPLGMVHGVVKVWHAGCGHIVAWTETGCVTGLPNPHVMADE